MTASLSVSRRRPINDRRTHISHATLFRSIMDRFKKEKSLGTTRLLVSSFVIATLLVVVLRSRHLRGGTSGSEDGAVDLMEYFVKVEGGRFVVGPKCDLFYVSGWNQWETVEAASGVLRLYGASLPQNMTGQQLIRSQLRKAQSYGFNLIRTWANPVSLEYTLMDSPGSYKEMMFRGLDYFLDEARKHGIRVVLNLMDNWQEAGGIPQFQGFAGIDTHEAFFQDENAWRVYADHVRAILQRRNTVNGRMYKDDPTIFSWELINEPRCAECPSAVLDTWITSMATLVKSIDPNHLLTVGEEGFFSNETPQQEANPSGKGSWAGGQGQNFISNHASENIDYGGIHMWIQNWEEATVDFAHRWLGEHIKQSKKLGKPLIMSEFGAWGNSKKMIKIRDGWYKKIYDMILEDARNLGPFQGGLFWQWFALGQRAPAEEGGSAGGVFGVFENEKSFEIALNFTKEIKRINSDYTFDGYCSDVLSKPAIPAHECTESWVRGIPGTGYEGSECKTNINECARGVHDCHENAECIDEDGGYMCLCHAGFSGDGRSCKKSDKAVQEIFASFQSGGPGQMACNQGKQIMYRPGYPGYMYDGTVEQDRQPVLYESSTRDVTEQECMTACRMADEGCNAFTFDSLQRKCFLHSIDVSNTDICPQPPSYCVAIRGKPYECVLLETYFDTTKFSSQVMDSQKIKKRTVRNTVLESYYDYVNIQI